MIRNIQRADQLGGIGADVGDVAGLVGPGLSVSLELILPTIPTGEAFPRGTRKPVDGVGCASECHGAQCQFLETGQVAAR